MFIRESYLANIEPFINKPVVKIISGMRRSGKSTFMKMLMGKLGKSGVKETDIIYISKELMDFDFIQDYKELYSYIKKSFRKNKNPKYLFIDEVQEITGWEKAINSLLAEGAADIYLTGSNSRMMSDELATLLTGRYVVIPMHPLSFKEFLQFRKVKNKDQTEKEFALYLKYGGLPGIHYLNMEDEIVFQYIESIYNTILLKDVVQRYQVRDVSLLERITKFIFDNSGSITTAKKISDYLKSQNISAGVQTVQNYISYIQEAFLINKAERYDIKGKRHLELYDKYYYNDSGIRHSVLKYRQEDISKLLENTVYLELIRRGYSVSFGKLDNLEVDFIAEKDSEKVYIQVCYLLSSKETEDREFGSLEKIGDNYKKMVLSMDKFWGSDRNGIIRMNIIDFLSASS
ncbi:MAG: ATP-binding protein [Candidatus Delongbacteria bacterium]|jgi:predicted AAA+ superfamily ATPase|nr:ATP-binding protein [Candidatus Delongbacteria bacterium]